MQQSGSTLQTRSVKNVCCGKSLIILSCVLYILAATKVFISLLTDARKLEDAIATEKKRLFVDKTKEEKMLHNFTVQPNSANNISVHFINQLAEQERKSSESPQIVQRETRRTNLLVAIHSDEVSSTNLGNATTIEPGPPPLSQQYPKGKISTKDNASLTRANPRTYDVDQGDKALLNSPSWEVLLNLPQCQGKRRLLEILSAAGLSAGNIKARCKDLPLWHQVASLYGEEPIILGLETCAEYRRSVDTNDPRTKRLNGLRIAGLYNSGTNALGKTIVMNMEGQNSIEKDWGDPGPSVPWGKHMPPRYRLSNRFLPDDPFNVMPVVIVRDPYRWLAAMCKAPYDARWQRSPYHCPNLAIADKEREIFGNLTKPFQLALSARQTGFAFTDYYDTLADLWSTFHEEYINATFPRVFVRFEDTIYHAEKVLKALAECVGIRIARKFRYLLDKPKKHGNPSDFVTALVKYGSSQGRFQGMLIEDHKYAQKRFPADFLAALHYSHATVNPLSKRDVPNGTMDILR